MDCSDPLTRPQARPTRAAEREGEISEVVHVSRVKAIARESDLVKVDKRIQLVYVLGFDNKFSMNT